jgi:hypothetical protein
VNPLTHCATRFVDRNIFMRYHGGGIRHKHMRVIEEIFGEMSRKRVHHKECQCTSLSQNSTDIGAADNSNSKDNPGTEGATCAQTDQTIGGNGSGSDSGSDLDYKPDSEDPGSSEGSNPEDLDSEGGVVDSYRLGDY